MRSGNKFTQIPKILDAGDKQDGAPQHDGPGGFHSVKASRGDVSE